MDAQAEVTTRQPVYLILIIDQSRDMAQPFPGERRKTKAQAVTDAINQFFAELLADSSTQSRHHSMQFTLIGCGGENAYLAGNGPLNGMLVIGLNDLAAPEAAASQPKRRFHLLAKTHPQAPAWLTSQAAGNRPLDQAFNMAYDSASTWVIQHPHAQPPVIINFFCGESHRNDWLESLEKLRQIHTSEGHLLMLSAYLTSEIRPSALGCSEAALRHDAAAETWWQMASIMPPPLLTSLTNTGLASQGCSRGFALIAETDSLTRLLRGVADFLILDAPIDQPVPALGTPVAASMLPPVEEPAEFGCSEQSIPLRRIIAEHPAGLVILLDQSASMGEPSTEAQPAQSKAMMVTRAVNALLQNLISLNSRNNCLTDNVEILILAYGAQSDAVWQGKLKGRQFVSLWDLANHSMVAEQAGLLDAPAAAKIPIWFEPSAKGDKNLGATLPKLKSSLENWMAYHQGSAPPMLVHITDGIAESVDWQGFQEINQMRLGKEAISTFNFLLKAGVQEPVLEPNELPPFTNLSPDHPQAFMAKGSSPLSRYALDHLRSLKFAIPEAATGFGTGGTLDHIQAFLSACLALLMTPEPLEEPPGEPPPVAPAWPACREFHIEKAGNTPEEYEDAIACQPDQRRFAISDGAAESSYSGLWAQILTRGFIKEALDFTAGPPKAWLEDLHQQWHKGIPWQRLSWNAEMKAQMGGFATFLGFWLPAPPTGTTCSWQAVAVGDSCLFHVRDNQLLQAFPLSQSAAFGLAPRLISSLSGTWDRFAARLLYASGTGETKDLFFLMTDALSKWALTEQERGSPPWTFLHDLANQEQFANWVNELRQTRVMVNDDVSLVIVEV